MESDLQSGPPPPFSSASLPLPHLDSPATLTPCFSQHNGRHPLQELVVDHFIPNDCHIAPNGMVPATPRLQHGAVHHEPPGKAVAGCRCGGQRADASQ